MLIDFDQIEFGPGLTQSSSLGEGKVFGGVIELWWLGLGEPECFGEQLADVHCIFIVSVKIKIWMEQNTWSQTNSIQQRVILTYSKATDWRLKLLRLFANRLKETASIVAKEAYVLRSTSLITILFPKSTRIQCAPITINRYQCGRVTTNRLPSIASLTLFPITPLPISLYLIIYPKLYYYICPNTTLCYSPSPHSPASHSQPIPPTTSAPMTTSSISSTANSVKPTASAQPSAPAPPASPVTPATTGTAYSARNLVASMVPALLAAPKLKARRSAALAAK